MAVSSNVLNKCFSDCRIYYPVCLNVLKHYNTDVICFTVAWFRSQSKLNVIMMVLTGAVKQDCGCHCDSCLTYSLKPGFHLLSWNAQKYDLRSMRWLWGSLNIFPVMVPKTPMLKKVNASLLGPNHSGFICVVYLIDVPQICLFMCRSSHAWSTHLCLKFYLHWESLKELRFGSLIGNIGAFYNWKSFNRDAMLLLVLYMA